MEYKIRKIKTNDFHEVRNICRETSDSHICNSEIKLKISCLLFVEYYIQYEPENCFVCINDTGEICGYIVASTNCIKFAEMMKKDILSRSEFKNIAHRVFGYFVLKNSIKADKKYGVGFHMNVKEKYQGNRIGPRLLDELCNHIRQKGFESIYLITRNRKTRGYSFYSHYGFKEVYQNMFGNLILAYNIK
ncbi:MAG: GNAT family N-acetyltransferase [Bacilli bacterium]